MGIQNMLSAVGLEKGIVYEVIVTTRAHDGTLNAAPMGIRSFDGRTLTFVPFKTSQTYRNLRMTRTAVANIIEDPRLFYETALKKGVQLPPEMFETSKRVEAPRLRGAESVVELAVLKEEEGPDKARVDCEPVYSEVLQLASKPYCRARFAAIEAVIHATRVRVLLREGKNFEAEKLIQSILLYRSLAERVSPDSKYSKVIEDVLSRVEEWKCER